MRHEAWFEIRTFHTDAFGHVNNARYLEFLEEARWQYAEQIGLTLLLREAELAFIIMDLHLRFRAPIAVEDSICVATQLISLGTSGGEVLQTISKRGQTRMATRCLSHFILIERSTGRAIPIQGDIRKLLTDVIAIEQNVPYSK